MAIALTEFSGFCGFRPLPEISDFLSKVPEFAAVVGPQVASAFSEAVSSSTSPSSSSKAADQDDLSKLQNALKELFAALMNADPESVVKPHLRALVNRYKKESGAKLSADLKPGSVEEIIVRLDEQFPDDVGTFCTFVLNVVELKPGEAIFLKADEPHAYLSGGDTISFMFFQFFFFY
jgi:mannose-6-phosphate isomerase